MSSYSVCCAAQALDLQSDSTPLLVRVPNHASGRGGNRETWIPNPGCHSDAHLAMFAFLGAVIGGAMRSRRPLELDLPPLMWKSLLGVEVGEDDLEAVDVVGANRLRSLLKLHRERDQASTEPDRGFGGG